MILHKNCALLGYCLAINPNFLTADDQAHTLPQNISNKFPLLTQS